MNLIIYSCYFFVKEAVLTFYIRPLYGGIITQDNNVYTLCFLISPLLFCNSYKNIIPMHFMLDNEC